MDPKDATQPLATDASAKDLSATGLTLTASPGAEIPVTDANEDPVDAYLRETGDEPAVAVQPKTDDAAPVVEAKADEAAPSGKVKDADANAPSAQAAPIAKPGEAPAAIAKPAEQPKPRSYDDNEVIGLAEGADWTRAQICAALRERNAMSHELPKVKELAAEANAFREIFGVDAKQAREYWSPILQRLSTDQVSQASIDTYLADRKAASFFDSYLADPDKAEYLRRCAAQWDVDFPAPASTGAKPAAQPAAPTYANDPRLVAQVNELAQWRAEQQALSAKDRLNRELEIIHSKYPFLASDQNLMRGLMTTAKALYAQDRTKGLLDVMQMNATMLDAVAIARANAATAQAAPAQNVDHTPALLGSPGAAPNGSRPAGTPRPQTFESTDDAVEAWLANPPQQFK